MCQPFAAQTDSKCCISCLLLRFLEKRIDKLQQNANLIEHIFFEKNLTVYLGLLIRLPIDILPIAAQIRTERGLNLKVG